MSTHGGLETRVPPTVLVLGGIVSVQFGGALAVTLIPQIGAGGSVLLRLGIAALILGAVARPRWRGHPGAAWRTVVAFGVTLGLMNFTFYSALARLPIGVAVTLEFLGPLVLAAVLSRRWTDGLAVLVAAGGVALIAQVVQVPFADLDHLGIALGLLTGVFWAMYVIFSGRTGAQFRQLDGLAIALVIGSLVVMPFGVGSIPEWSGPVVLKGVGIAVLSSLIPYSLELIALRRLRASVFGILLSLEPAVAAGAGLLVLGQRLTPWQLAGMGLVVLASILVLGRPTAAEPDPRLAADVPGGTDVDGPQIDPAA